MEEKYNNLKLTQKEICNRLQLSDRTIRRYRDDIKMDGPYRINNNKKKTPKQKPSTVTEKNENQLQKNHLKKKLSRNALKTDSKMK